MYCTNCGLRDDDHVKTCMSCGASLPPPQPAPSPVGSGSEAVSSIVPYRNICALVAYYLAVFALIPCLGLLLGPAGSVLGLLGLPHARLHPETKGRVHAWIGVIAGGLLGLGNIAGLVLMVNGVMWPPATSRRGRAREARAVRARVRPGGP